MILSLKMKSFFSSFFGMCFEIIHNGPEMFRSFSKPPPATTGSDVRGSPPCVPRERGERGGRGEREREGERERSIAGL